MPAVTPADVYTRSSRTKMGSRSTRTAGNRRASASHAAQWVVARRPSSSPASARRNAPVHTAATRLARRAVRRIQGTMRPSRARGRVPSPPATRSVSTGPVARARLRCATRDSPLEVTTGPADGATSVSA